MGSYLLISCSRQQWCSSAHFVEIFPGVYAWLQKDIVVGIDWILRVQPAAEERSRCSNMKIRLLVEEARQLWDRAVHVPCCATATRMISRTRRRWSQRSGSHHILQCAHQVRMHSGSCSSATHHAGAAAHRRTCIDLLQKLRVVSEKKELVDCIVWGIWESRVCDHAGLLHRRIRKVEKRWPKRRRSAV